jgi:hypothetical protein
MVFLDFISIVLTSLEFKTFKKYYNDKKIIKTYFIVAGANCFGENLVYRVIIDVLFKLN